MRLYPDSKVYILCPGNHHTGGIEDLHQICSQLITFGVDAYMVYIVNNSFNLKTDPVDSLYRKYHLSYSLSPEDSAHNIFVVPEIFSVHFYRMKNFQKIFWWLSVDNYIEEVVKLINSRKSSALSALMPKFFYFGKEDNDITHFAQSEYARQFLIVNGVPEYKIYMVEDYIGQAFLSRASQIDLSKKENFVAFNPAKGFEVTQQLMKFAPDIAWRPIQNMTPEQVQELLARAKVYIDFGNHPGRDKIPREAAISGCVVITGRRGSAGNDIDINIPAEFKFDERKTNLQQIISKIREVFENFSAAHEKQADYRARILDDKNRFAEEVAEAFKIKNLPPPSLAFVQGTDDKILLLAKELFKSKDFKPSFIVDDEMASPKNPDRFIFHNQNRNYLRIGENLIEIITKADAKFLYQEGRIKKFALFEPKDIELAEVKNFYKPNYDDVMIFNR